MIAAAAVVLLLAVIVIPGLRDNRSRRKQADAVEERQVGPYWAGVKAALAEPYSPLPGVDNPKAGGARIASDRQYRAVQAARRARDVSDMPRQMNRGRSL